MTGMVTSLQSLEVNINLHTLAYGQSSAVWCDKEWLIHRELKLRIALANVPHKKSLGAGILKMNMDALKFMDN